MSELLSESDRAFLAWEENGNCHWHQAAIKHNDEGVPPHKVWGQLYSSTPNVNVVRHKNATQLQEALQFDSPIVEQRLANASYTSSLIFIPEIAKTIMNDDETHRPRLFSILDNMLPRLKVMVSENMRAHQEEEEWVRQGIYGHIMGLSLTCGRRGDDAAKQAANGVVYLLYVHGISLGEELFLPFPELPYRLPKHPQQGDVIQASQLVY